MPATRVTVKKNRERDRTMGGWREDGSWRRETFKQDAALAAIRHKSPVARSGPSPNAAAPKQRREAAQGEPSQAAELKLLKNCQTVQICSGGEMARGPWSGQGAPTPWKGIFKREKGCGEGRAKCARVELTVAATNSFGPNKRKT